VKQDPLALAFLGAALALLAGLLSYVLVFKKPEPAPPAGTPGTLESLRSHVESAVDQLRDKPVPPPAARPAPTAPKAPPPAAAARPTPPAGAAQGPTPAKAPPAGLPTRAFWRYAVSVEPPIWTQVTLDYISFVSQADGALKINSDFQHSKGSMRFELGVFDAGHPSHANTRFPGFFMHPAYFPLPLHVGQRFSWGWAWQPVAPGRMKRYEGRVTRVEDVTVPAGTFRAAVIEADLYYIEAGQVRAQARETLWYAPEVQIVKVVREGRTPDESSSRIVAELKSFVKQ
jgi:hypothetical protein